MLGQPQTRAGLVGQERAFDGHAATLKDQGVCDLGKRCRELHLASRRRGNDNEIEPRVGVCSAERSRQTVRACHGERCGVHARPSQVHKEDGRKQKHSSPARNKKA